MLKKKLWNNHSQGISLGKRKKNIPIFSHNLEKRGAGLKKRAKGFYYWRSKLKHE